MGLDFEFSEEHLMIQDSMKKCLEPFKGRREELVKMVLKDKIFPQEVWDAVTGTGLMGCMVPEEYGGNGLGLLGVGLCVFVEFGWVLCRPTAKPQLEHVGCDHRGARDRAYDWCPAYP